MKRVMTFVMAFLFCFLAIPAFALGGAADGNSISPHAEGVCAPNTAVVLVDKLEDTEPVEAVEEAEEQDPERDEPAEAPEEIGEEEELTIDEMVQANRDPDSVVWYNIEDEACTGHEWEYCDSFRFCLNCGCTEPFETLEEVCDDESEIDDAEEDAEVTEICDDAEQTQYADGSLD